jgi:hypothetical protein
MKPAVKYIRRSKEVNNKDSYLIHLLYIAANFPFFKEKSVVCVCMCVCRNYNVLFYNFLYSTKHVTQARISEIALPGYWAQSPVPHHRKPHLTFAVMITKTKT